jgi:hypothetical protein
VRKALLGIARKDFEAWVQGVNYELPFGTQMPFHASEASLQIPGFYERGNGVEGKDYQGESPSQLKPPDIAVGPFHRKP